MLTYISSSNDEAPSKEATAIRKRLLDSFHQYDMIAKRIGQLPAPPGGSQDRVQRAVVMRANMFLQKNMFPLQVRRYQAFHCISNTHAISSVITQAKGEDCGKRFESHDNVGTTNQWPR